MTSVDRMGRIFKVLSNGVEDLVQNTSRASIGDLKNLTPNAQALLKMSLLSGWAQLQLASADQSYLETIVKPFISKLAPLWLNSLKEFASLRFEPEISDSLGIDNMTSNLDDRYAAFNRTVRLQFYQSTWLNIVNAISALVESDSEAILYALDDKSKGQIDQINGDDGQENASHARQEPVSFFFVLFGLVFEALVVRGREDASHILSILQALRKILNPAVAGNTVYGDVVFNETTDTLDRLALTSSFQTQLELIEVARILALEHPSTRTPRSRDEKLSDDIEQLFELTRIAILVLIGIIPTLEDPPGNTLRIITPEAVSLVEASFQGLVHIAEVFPRVIRTDLCACVFHCYCTILATGLCQEEVLPAILPIFREFLLFATKKPKGDTITKISRGALHQMLIVLSIAQRRENEYSITCAKNSLLSVTVLLTSAGPVLPSNDPIVRKAIEEILDCLQDVGLAKVAANCAKSLLVTNPKTPSGEAIGRLLWPKLISFICDEDTEDPELVRPTLVSSLVASVASLTTSRRQPATAILIPVILHRASNPTENEREETLRKESSARLLELAAADQIGFRVTVGSLQAEDRALLEELLRTAGVGRTQQVGGEERAEDRPTIELRMDF